MVEKCDCGGVLNLDAEKTRWKSFSLMIEVFISWSCLTGLLLLAYFVVVAGWGLAYANQMQAGVFSSPSVSLLGEQFQALLANPQEMVYWQSLFLLVVVVIAAFGVRRGVGLVVWLIVPVLVVLLAVLIQYAFDVGDMEAARAFLFSAKRIDFTAESVLVALVFSRRKNSVASSGLVLDVSSEPLLWPSLSASPVAEAGKRPAKWVRSQSSRKPSASASSAASVSLIVVKSWRSWVSPALRQ